MANDILLYHPLTREEVVKLISSNQLEGLKEIPSGYRPSLQSEYRGGHDFAFFNAFDVIFIFMFNWLVPFKASVSEPNTFLFELCDQVTDEVSEMVQDLEDFSLDNSKLLSYIISKILPMSIALQMLNMAPKFRSGDFFENMDDFSIQVRICVDQVFLILGAELITKRQQ